MTIERLGGRDHGGEYGPPAARIDNRDCRGGPAVSCPHTGAQPAHDPLHRIDATLGNGDLLLLGLTAFAGCYYAGYFPVASSWPGRCVGAKRSPGRLGRVGVEA